MPSDDIVISVRGLSKAYRLFGHTGDRIKQFVSLGLKQYHRSFTALQDISFDVCKGETVGIIGRNGSGKSTLLQVICGILKPTSGSIHVRGRISALLELGAGFNPEFTGRENVYFQGALMGIHRKQMDKRFDEIATFADIGDFLDQPLRTYSSGMYVRLAFAAAINVDPDVLIVDEALAVGDTAFQAKCMSALERARANGMTILFVSHDLDTVRSLCDKAVYLEQGKVKEYGAGPAVVESYLRDTYQSSTTGAVLSRTQTLSPKAGTLSNPEFSARVATTRYGTGEAQFADVELTDTDGKAINTADFGQDIKIRLCIRFLHDCEVVVSYYLRDNKLQVLAGSSTTLEGYGLLPGREGQCKVIEFTTTLPLAEGDYSVLAVISRPLVVNQSAQFVDYVENALVFQVTPRRPLRIWSKVYIANTLAVYDV